jgi:hypothetical protein
MQAGHGKVLCDIHKFINFIMNNVLIIVLQIRRTIQLIAVIIQAYYSNQLHTNIYSSSFRER